MNNSFDEGVLYCPRGCTSNRESLQGNIMISLEGLNRRMSMTWEKLRRNVTKQNYRKSGQTKGRMGQRRERNYGKLKSEIKM